MDETWERAVETALDGQTDPAAARSLTLDGAVKCLHGRLPPPSFLERFENLHHLSIANTGVSSLEQFPRLPNLQKLILSDNRISGGLEFLVAAGLGSLRDLDLSNNRIQYIEDLAPLASLRLVSLDLYECPVTRVKDYRSRVFGLITSVRFLDKMDADGNERLESDDDESDDDDEEDDDPGSGEVDGEDRPFNNGHGVGRDGIVDVDEDDESDADEEPELSVSRRPNGSNHVQANGYRVAHTGGDDDGGAEDDDGEDEEDVESVEEIDDEEEDGDEDVVEVHEIEDSDNDDDGVEDEDDDEEDDDEDEEEDVENEEGDLAEPERIDRVASTAGEIDAHEHGEDDGEEDDNGETGEEEPVEDDGDFEEEEEDYGSNFLVRPVGQAEGDGYIDLENEEDDSDEEEVEDVQMLPSSSSQLKRTRDDNDGDDDDDGGDGEEEEDEEDEDDDGEDDSVVYRNPLKKQR